MELILATCEEFAADNNLKFSTDPDPKKSRTKCIYMWEDQECGVSCLSSAACG
jgi:hypothetical protein